MWKGGGGERGSVPPSTVVPYVYFPSNLFNFFELNNNVLFNFGFGNSLFVPFLLCLI